MHDDTTGGDGQAQGAAAQAPRIIWRDNRPFVIDDFEPDGVIRIVPLRIVPEAFFRAGLDLPLPDWALDSPDIIDNPPMQFLVLINGMVEQRRGAVAALRNIRASVKTAAIMLSEGDGPAMVAQRLDDAIKRINVLSAGLEI